LAARNARSAAERPDELKRSALRRLKITIRRLLRRGPVPPVVKAVRADSLTCIGEGALCDLYDRIVRLEAEGVGGVLIEAGCALGGSAIVMATAKAKSRPLYVYDVFGMIPPPSQKDGEDVHDRYEVIRSGKAEGIDGGKYYGYEADLLGKVAGNFRRHGVPVEDNDVHLVKGMFQDALHVRDKVALAHIDGDWYESVTICLQRIAPHLIPGGALVIDDYDYWSGCRAAVDKYFSDKKDAYEFALKAQLYVTRK